MLIANSAVRGGECRGSLQTVRLAGGDPQVEEYVLGWWAALSLSRRNCRDPSPESSRCYRSLTRPLVYAGKTVELAKVARDAHDVTGLLKMFLRELPEALLTWELYDCFLAATGERGPQLLSQPASQSER